MKKTDQEKIKLMVCGGKVLSQIMEELLKMSVPGVTTLAINNQAENLMKKYGVEPSFKRVSNYQFGTCLCVNDTVVHGIPTNYQLKKGDILGIDVGVIYKDFNTDMSWSVIIGEENAKGNFKDSRFLEIGRKALIEAIKQTKVGNRVGHISQTIQNYIEKNGFSVAKQLVGHGVGEELHQWPQIPGILSKPIDKTPLLTAGMTLAVEVIYAEKKADIAYKNDDGWTIVTRDGSLAGLFEASVALTESETQILTPFTGLLKQARSDIINT